MWMSLSENLRETRCNLPVNKQSGRKALAAIRDNRRRRRRRVAQLLRPASKRENLQINAVAELFFRSLSLSHLNSSTKLFFLVNVQINVRHPSHTLIRVKEFRRIHGTQMSPLLSCSVPFNSLCQLRASPLLTILLT